MSSQNILVTGGAGYVGSHVCKALAEEGWTPITYDNLSNGHEWAVQWGPLEIGDIRDRERLKSIVQTYNPAGALHFAGRIEVGESIRQPILFYDINVNGTLVLVDVLVEAGVEALIFSSTAATYGLLNHWPVSEEHPCAPFTPYGRSKFMAEQVISDSGTSHGLKWTTLRYFNAAGAAPSGELGEAHRNEIHLIPLVIQAAMGKRQAFSIYGTDYATPDGTCIRDFIHVTDLAAAHVSALKRLLGGGESVLLNLGTGVGVSVLEVVKALEEVAGVPVPTEIQDRRVGDPPILVGDPRRAQTVLPWMPQRSDLISILADAWAWHTSDFCAQLEL
ncbi:UDP-glucose 4-epimerase GalE [Rhodospirillum sp. A1_3_36]|uniref:UDP-glucose 4-epimerase GalE n=1 Tax=Rhodospirillum sp. A1_3_36 TaxID=3391666 RepID=UPI0039A5519F